MQFFNSAKISYIQADMYVIMSSGSSQVSRFYLVLSRSHVNIRTRCSLNFYKTPCWSTDIFSTKLAVWRCSYSVSGGLSSYSSISIIYWWSLPYLEGTSCIAITFVGYGTRKSGTHLKWVLPRPLPIAHEIYRMVLHELCWIGLYNNLIFWTHYICGD